MTRAATALVLAAGVVFSPSVLDACATSCEAHHAAVAVTPGCHHGSATSDMRVGAVPSRCGHDHAGRVAAPVVHTESAQRAFDCVTTLAVLTPAPAYASCDRFSQSHAPPGSALTLDAHSLPLRI
jgi:hypothetical protein